MAELRLRTMEPGDSSELAELIYLSLNTWHQLHGRSAIFTGGPRVAEVFSEVYETLDPGCCVVAEEPRTGRLMGSCFYHPRKLHVALGIMNVHPNYFGRGVARAMLDHVVAFTDRGGFPALRLTSSALNLDSFSLYTRAGFVPRVTYQDLVLQVPAAGLGRRVPGDDRVRGATMKDVPAIDALEMELCGVTREKDYRYFLANEAGFWHASVHESPRGEIEGFMISCGHPAFKMLGPCVARTEEQALALIARELDHYRGQTPVFLVPVECARIVRPLYEWGARNCELHLCQVRGAFTPFKGISMPTFLPETA